MGKNKKNKNQSHRNEVGKKNNKIKVNNRNKNNDKNNLALILGVLLVIAIIVIYLLVSNHLSKKRRITCSAKYNDFERIVEAQFDRKGRLKTIEDTQRNLIEDDKELKKFLKITDQYLKDMKKIVNVKYRLKVKDNYVETYTKVDYSKFKENKNDESIIYTENDFYRNIKFEDAKDTLSYGFGLECK